MIEHTEGPWFASGGGGVASRVTQERLKSGRVVQRRTACAKGLTIAEVSANARLIAAAPDGYGLAIRVVEYFGGSTPDGLDAEKLDCDAELLRMALAIIAKVEGGV